MWETALDFTHTLPPKKKKNQIIKEKESYICCIRVQEIPWIQLGGESCWVLDWHCPLFHLVHVLSSVMLSWTLTNKTNLFSRYFSQSSSLIMRNDSMLTIQMLLQLLTSKDWTTGFFFLFLGLKINSSRPPFSNPSGTK